MTPIAVALIVAGLGMCAYTWLVASNMEERIFHNDITTSRIFGRAPYEATEGGQKLTVRPQARILDIPLAFGSGVLLMAVGSGLAAFASQCRRNAQIACGYGSSPRPEKALAPGAE